MSRVPERRRAGSGRPPTIATETQLGDPKAPDSAERRARRSPPRTPPCGRRGLRSRRGTRRRAGAGRQAGRIARSTAFFSIATAASRIAGLRARSSPPATTGSTARCRPSRSPSRCPTWSAPSSPTPRCSRPSSRSSPSSWSKKNYREAFRLASTLLLLVTLVLGAITALFVLLAPVLMPLFAPGFEGEILDLTVTLSQVLFPILILLGMSGVVVGILNSYDRFGAFAISPLFWNLTIIVVLVFLEPPSTARTGSTPTRSASSSAPWSSCRSPPSTCATRRSSSAGASTGATPACAASCC